MAGHLETAQPAIWPPAQQASTHTHNTTKLRENRLADTSHPLDTLPTPSPKDENPNATHVHTTSVSEVQLLLQHACQPAKSKGAQSAGKQAHSHSTSGA